MAIPEKVWQRGIIIPIRDQLPYPLIYETSESRTYYPLYDVTIGYFCDWNEIKKRLDSVPKQDLGYNGYALVDKAFLFIDNVLIIFHPANHSCYVKIYLKNSYLECFYNSNMLSQGSIESCISKRQLTSIGPLVSLNKDILDINFH